MTSASSHAIVSHLVLVRVQRTCAHVKAVQSARRQVHTIGGINMAEDDVVVAKDKKVWSDQKRGSQ